jgi:alpha-L-rhamnosidase
LKENWPTIKHWLAFLETKSQDSLLVRWGGEWDFLGDWLWPGASGVNGELPETQCLNNCYWVYELRIAAKIAEILGDKSDGSGYSARAGQVAKAVNARFYRPATHDYAIGDQAYIAAALLADVPPPDERPAVWKRLEDEILVHREGHIYAGITGGALMTRLLLDAGRADLMMPMVATEEYPGWGHFLASGFTTVPEDWEARESLLHSSFLFVGAWFIEGVGGITFDPDTPGFQHFLLRPMVTGLDSAATTYESAYGQIRCAWWKSDGKLRMAVTVPPNSTAILSFPCPGVDAVKESGTPARKAKGVKWLRDDPGHAVLRLEPGSFSFTTG